jgi:hypothetical protein
VKILIYASIPLLLLLGIEAHAVVGGVSAIYPNVALLENWQHKGVVRICTGTWIGARTLLTAAHCGSEGDKIRVSSSDSPERDSAYPFYSLMGVFHPHPDYKAGSHALDVAIIETDIQHPNYFSDFRLSPSLAVQPGDWAFIAGYGCTSRINNTGYLEPHAAATKVLTAVDQEIRTRFSRKKSFFSFLGVTPKLESAGGCNGDSGGPLFVVREDKIVQIGVASWTPEKGDLGGANSFTAFVSLSNASVQTFLQGFAYDLQLDTPSVER